MATSFQAKVTLFRQAPPTVLPNPWDENYERTVRLDQRYGYYADKYFGQFKKYLDIDEYQRSDWLINEPRKLHTAEQITPKVPDPVIDVRNQPPREFTGITVRHGKNAVQYKPQQVAARAADQCQPISSYCGKLPCGTRDVRHATLKRTRDFYMKQRRLPSLPPFDRKFITHHQPRHRYLMTEEPLMYNFHPRSKPLPSSIRTHQ